MTSFANMTEEEQQQMLLRGIGILIASQIVQSPGYERENVWEMAGKVQKFIVTGEVYGVK